MSLTNHTPGLFARPKVVLLGSDRATLGVPHDRLAALERQTVIRSVQGRSSWHHGVRMFSEARRAILRDGFELIHVDDSRLAPVAALLRSRYAVPVTIDLAGPPSRPIAPFVRRLDHAFAADQATASAVAARLPSLRVSLAPPGARSPTEPRPRVLASIVRRLGRVAPARLIVAMPWPADVEQLRWYRDAVAPLLHGDPICLLLGAPSLRQARLIVGAVGVRGRFRAHAGALDAQVVSAAARCADVLFVPGPAQRCVDTTGLLHSMLATRVPVVAGGGVSSDALRHEDNCLVVRPGDAMGAVSTLNQVLALPAVQRHYLGEEFSRWTADHLTWDAAAAAYAERWSALVGRPQIPEVLRAA